MPNSAVAEQHAIIGIPSGAAPVPSGFAPNVHPEAAGPAREFLPFFVLPVRLPGPQALELEHPRLLAEKNALLLEIDPLSKCTRSLSPGLPNVSLHVAGHDFQWGGKSKGEQGFEPISSISAQPLLGKMKTAKHPATIQQLVPASVRWRGEGNQVLAALIQSLPQSDDSDTVAEAAILDYQELNGKEGITGLSFKTSSGREAWFQIAPNAHAELNAGPGSTQEGSLFVTRKDGVLSGVAMDSLTVTLNGKNYPSNSAASPIDTVVIQPQQTIFTDSVMVSFDIPKQSRTDLEFRKGVPETPWNIAGVNGSKTVSAIFRETKPLPSVQATNPEPGLDYEYFEGKWPILLSHSGMYSLLPAKGSGLPSKLLDPEQVTQIRQTDRSYSIKYDGFIDVPESGVYRFFAPEPLYNTTKDAGYELRVWINGQEWFSNPDLHAENIWSVALEKGLHRFQVSFVDFRWKQFRHEYWMSWNPAQIWDGIPVLEVDGPEIPRQALPSAWLKKIN